MFLLSWRLFEQIARSGNNVELPERNSYTGLVFGETYCFELMLVVIFAPWQQCH